MRGPDRDIYFLALALLYVLRDYDEYSDVARLALILDRESFDSLIDNCGGMTFRVPTRDEVDDALRALLYYQLRYIRHLPVPTVLRECEISPAQAKRIQPLCQRFGRYLSRLNPNVVDVLSMSMGES